MQFLRINEREEKKEVQKILEANLEFLYDKLDTIDEDEFNSNTLINYVDILTKNNIRVKDVNADGTFKTSTERIKCHIFKESIKGLRVLVGTEYIRVNTKGKIIGDGVLCHNLYYYDNDNKTCIDYHIVGKNINDLNFDIAVEQVDQQDLSTFMKLISSELHDEVKVKNKYKK